MTKTKILLLEDNILQSAALAAMLSDFGYEVIGTAASGERVLRLFKEKSPDLVLLDIKVEGNMDGIEVGKVMTQLRPTPIIYLTAHDDEFKRAMVTHPAAFFPKPYNERDLLNAIDLAIHNFAKHLKPSDGKQAEVPSFSNIYFSADCLWLKTKSGGPFFRVLISEILFVQAENVYIDIYVQSRPTPHTLTLGIGEFADHAPYSELAQANRSCVANVAHIVEFTTTKARLTSGHEIPISKTYSKSFIAAILTWRQRQSF